MENKEKQFYSPQEVAELLGLHTYTVLRHISANRLYATNVGTDKRKKYRISHEDLTKFINNGRHDASKQPGATQNPQVS